MSTQIATTNGANGGIIRAMAQHYEMEPAKFFATIKATVFPQGKPVTDEQAAAFLVVAKQYNLNPFIKEIYAFPGRGGGVVPIVSVDGWATLINRQEQLDGIQFEDRFEGNELIAVTCRIFRKDRSHATEVTEYMAECSRDTDTWGKWPARMLRHKALIQCARYAFGLVGIYDPDEAERIASASPDAEPEPIRAPQRKSAATGTEGGQVIEAQVEPQGASEAGQAALEFNPLADSAASYLTPDDAKKINRYCGKLQVDPDEEVAKFFKIAELKCDEISHEAASMLIGDLKERAEAK